ncbi:hypothetical protein KJ359_003350 [Pestalotiopsis sp. 9143b]|nr:hypothetical protein KJ359_003350 [Pestalotiopsis sp. 9143b]
MSESLQYKTAFEAIVSGSTPSETKVLRQSADLSDDDFKILNIYIDQGQEMTPVGFRTNVPSAQLQDLFAEKTFQYWSSDKGNLPEPQAHKPKISGTAIIVGKWKYDLVSKEASAKKRKASEMASSADETPNTPKRVRNTRRGIPSPTSSPHGESPQTIESKPIKASKRKGANAYCRPELSDVAINFRFVDGEGSYHLGKDIDFDGGMFTGAMRREACLLWDNTNLDILGRYNNEVVVYKFRRYLNCKYHHHGEMDNAPPDVTFRRIILQTPTWDACIETIRNTPEHPYIPRLPLP